jgi:hypothetical protein
MTEDQRELLEEARDSIAAASPKDLHVMFGRIVSEATG